MSDLLTRDQIIGDWFAKGGLVAAAAAEEFAAGVTLAAPPPPAAPAADAAPVADAPPVADKPAKDEAVIDATITEQIAAMLAAAKRAVSTQGDDPGNEKDPADAKVLAGLEQIVSILGGIAKDQAADTAAGSPPADKAPPAAPATDKAGPPAADALPPAASPAKTSAAGVAALADGAVPGNADGIPGDSDDSGPGPGDIEANVACQNPNCGHLGSAHQDTDLGENQGSCQMADCTCPGMVPNATQVVGPDDTTGGPNNEGGDSPPVDDSKLAGLPALAPLPPMPAPEAKPVQTGQLPPLDPMPQVATGPAFTIPVGVIEGMPTGDGRQIEAGALTWRTPPLPLMWLDTSAHDPSGMSPNDPAVLVGRIDTIERDGANIKATGFFHATEEGLKAAEQLQQQGRFGVSADIGAAEVQITADPSAPPVADVFDAPLLEMLVAGELMGFTGCPFAAFAGCFIILGDDPAPTAAKALPPAPADAQMAIHYVDAQPCETCEGGLPLVASGAPQSSGGPVAPPKRWFEDPGFSRDDARLRETIDAKTGRPSGKFACPITVTADGQVFGHIAQWGVCHQSPMFLSKGQCVLAPRSKMDYAWFHGRGSVLTAEGELIDVGRISADVGHASLSSTLSAAQVLAHYDNSALNAASVRAGEDEFGIWVAGAVHPSASAEQVYTLRACPPSGDWRPVGSGQELVAVLCVNEPGFPVAKATIRPSTGRISSLVAAGVPMFEMPREMLVVHEPTFEERFSQMEKLLGGSLLRLAAEDARRRMALVRAS